MKAHSFLNQRSLKSLEPSPRKVAGANRLLGKNRTATNSRPGELSDEPQLVIYYDNKADEPFSRKNSAPDSQLFLPVHNSNMALEKAGFTEGLKKSPSLNITRSSFVGASTYNSPDPTERILYHTKTFSLSEEIGANCEYPVAANPSQVSSKEASLAPSGNTETPKRSFISSLKLFDQEPSARIDDLLHRQASLLKKNTSSDKRAVDLKKPKPSMPQNSANRSGEMSKAERSALTDSQFENATKLPYSGHLNIVNSNVYVQYQLGTPKQSSKLTSKPKHDSPLRQVPFSPQARTLHKEISSLASRYNSSSSLVIKQPSKLLILPKDSGFQLSPTKQQPKKKKILDLNLASEARLNLGLASMRTNQSPPNFQSKVIDPHATSKQTPPSDKKAGSLATLKSMLVKSIHSSSKDYQLYKSEMDLSSSADSKQTALFFSQMAPWSCLIDIQGSAVSLEKSQPVVRKMPSKKLLIADGKSFQASKSLDRIGLCAYHGIKQPKHLQELHQEIELLLTGCNPVSDAAIPKKFYLPPKKKPDIGTLILGFTDLLVRELLPQDVRHSPRPADLITLPVGESKTEVRVFQVRPGLKEAIGVLADMFELVVWSEESAEITNSVLDVIDPEHQYITFRLYRDECFEVNLVKRGPRIVKPHNIFANRSYQDVFQLCYQANFVYPYLDRMIPIIPFRTSTDGELAALAKWINMIADRQGSFLTQLLQFIERDFGFTTTCNKFLEKMVEPKDQSKQ